LRGKDGKQHHSPFVSSIQDLGVNFAKMAVPKPASRVPGLAIFTDGLKTFGEHPRPQGGINNIRPSTILIAEPFLCQQIHSKIMGDGFLLSPSHILDKAKEIPDESIRNSTVWARRSHADRSPDAGTGHQPGPGEDTRMVPQL
jgi:hypothetical protein